MVYCPNPGNAGDSLIAVATMQLFAKLGIGVKWVGCRKVVEPGRIVFYGGGGNLVANYPDAACFIEANHRQAERLVLLPHTVEGHGELLRGLGANVDLITREPVSHAYCREAARGANVHLSEDLALWCDVGELRRLPLPGPLEGPLPEKKHRRKAIRRAMLDERLGRLFFPWKRRLLKAGRMDRERAEGREVAKGNRDVSDLFSYGVRDEETVSLSARHFMDFVDGYDSVETDRLHVCIGAALLGKKVIFHPNSYFKNEAVYRHSLERRFPLIRWVP